MSIATAITSKQKVSNSDHLQIRNRCARITFLVVASLPFDVLLPVRRSYFNQRSIDVVNSL